MPSQLLIGGFWTLIALIQGAGVYSIDRNRVAAVSWFLFIAAFGWAYEPIGKALIASVMMVRRLTQSGTAGRRFSMVLVPGVVAGPLFGPIAALLIQGRLGLRISGLHTVEIGLLGGVIFCGLYGLAVAVVMSRRSRDPIPFAHKSNAFESAGDKTVEREQK